MPIREKITPYTTLALAFTTTCTILLAWVWWTAYTHGGRVTITVNEYGEQYPELAMWVVVLGVVGVGVYKYFKRRG